MKAPHLLRGRSSEHKARNWLRKQGLSFVTANYHCRYGEIDLIMLEKETLVITEVRYRNSNLYGGPLHSVTRDKQRKLLLAAGHYLQHHPEHRDYAMRFDVIALSAYARQPVWIRSAFNADGLNR